MYSNSGVINDIATALPSPDSSHHFGSKIRRKLRVTYRSNGLLSLINLCCAIFFVSFMSGVISSLFLWKLPADLEWLLWPLTEKNPPPLCLPGTERGVAVNLAVLSTFMKDMHIRT